MSYSRPGEELVLFGTYAGLEFLDLVFLSSNYPPTIWVMGDLPDPYSHIHLVLSNSLILLYAAVILVQKKLALIRHCVLAVSQLPSHFSHILLPSSFCHWILSRTTKFAQQAALPSNLVEKLKIYLLAAKSKEGNNKWSHQKHAQNCIFGNFQKVRLWESF